MQIEIDVAKLERGTHEGRVKVTRGGKTFYRKQRVGQKEKPNRPVIAKKKVSDESPYADMSVYIKNDERVTPEMLDAVDLYTSERYGDINEALREGNIDDYSDLSEDVNNISKFINNAPKFDGVVYRGMEQFDSSDDFIDFVEQIAEYGVIEFPSFVSSSTDKGVAEGFAESNQSIMFEIVSRNGVFLNGASGLTEEQEVLFDYGSKFSVISVDQDDGRFFIRLEET